MRMVLWRGVSLVGIGTVIGLAGALAVSRLLGGILYGVTSTDWPTYIVVSAGLIGIGALACYVPARRATHLDPAIVLRSE
jgi:ABC-type antimicrobial peptide transport system permease subunit